MIGTVHLVFWCVCVYVSTFILLWGGSVCVTNLDVVARLKKEKNPQKKQIMWNVQRPAEEMCGFSFFKYRMLLKQ